MPEIESSSEKELLGCGGFFKKKPFLSVCSGDLLLLYKVECVYICKWQQLCHPITILPEKLCLHQGKVRGV